MDGKFEKKRLNAIKRLIRQIVKFEKENGISPWAKLRCDFSILLKLPEKISKKISCVKEEKLYYQIWDNIGERIHYAVSTENKYSAALNLISAPLYLYNYQELLTSENLNQKIYDV